MNENLDIFENLHELFYHPDLKVRLYILKEMITGDFSYEDKEEFILHALKNNSLKIQETTINLIFKHISDISNTILKSMLSTLCISNKIKIIDILMDKLSNYNDKKVIKAINEILENYIIDLHKNIFSLLVKIQDVESFDIILEKFIEEENTDNLNFFNDIIDKKITFINENNFETEYYPEKIYSAIKKCTSEKAKLFLMVHSLNLGEDSIDHLYYFWNEYENPEIIVKTLGKFNSQKLFQIFFNRLKNKNDQNNMKILNFAIQAFSFINPDKVFSLIDYYHQNLSDYSTLINAVCENNNTDLVNKLLKSNKKEIIRIGLSLGKHLKTGMNVALLKSLTKNTDESIRIAALEILSNENINNMLDIYKEMLSDPSEKVQDAVLGILSNYKNQNVNNLLVEELNNKSLKDKIIIILGDRNLDNYINNFHTLPDKARENMVKALIKTSDDILKKALIMCKNADINTRFAGVKTLSYILPEHMNIVLTQFNNMLSDPDALIRSTISAALKDVESPIATTILLSLLKDPNKRVRANCIESFTYTKNKKAVISTLVTFVNDPNNRIRGNALIILYKLGYTDIKKYLKTMLDSTDKWMKVTALFVIGETSLETMAYYAVSMLTSNDMDLKKNALIALTKINLPQFTVHIKRLTNDINESIRKIAQDYLISIKK